MEGGSKSDYDILHIEVYNRKGKHLEDKDFKLKFIKTRASKKDVTKRFDKYSNNAYNKYFDELFIPTVIKNTFIVSDTVSPYNKLKKNTVIAFLRPEKDTTPVTIEYGEYRYVKEGNEFIVNYIGENKSNITSYPFGGFSEFKVSYCECYQNLKITNFDFSKIMMDRCISTERMFYKCTQLKEVINFAPHLYKIPLADMTEMFAYCILLSNIDLSELNQSFNIYRIQRMFYACLSLEKIDITGLKLSGKYGDDADISSMFANCYGLREIICLKDQLLSIRESLPNYEVWTDERTYKGKNKSNGKSTSMSKKTKRLKYVNTLFKEFIIMKDLDKENKQLLVKNECKCK